MKTREAFRQRVYEKAEAYQQRRRKRIRRAAAVLTPVMVVVIICSILFQIPFRIGLGGFPIIRAENLMEGISAGSVEGRNPDAIFTEAMAEFSLEIFRQGITEEKNSLISPLSVLLALSMTANGTAGETLKQMEQVLGKGMELEQLNQYLHAYIQSLYSGQQSELRVANSIWFRDSAGFHVEKSFLQTNADYYGADVYKKDFTLPDAPEAMNHWVQKNTDNLIREIVDQIDPDAMMYLINAIVFDAEWQQVYGLQNVGNGTFRAFGNQEKQVDFMHSEETVYLENSESIGFKKSYKGGKFEFVALLPKEGIGLSDYIASLTGEAFLNLMESAAGVPVSASLPKFTYDYTVNLNDGLQAMGITNAFHAAEAEFSPMGYCEDGKLYMANVLHKTFIAVDELGTKAGAVTSVEMKAESALLDMKVVDLNRPFVYAIVDSTTNLPIFIGTVLDV